MVIHDFLYSFNHSPSYFHEIPPRKSPRTKQLLILGFPMCSVFLSTQGLVPNQDTYSVAAGRHAELDEGAKKMPAPRMECLLCSLITLRFPFPISFSSSINEHEIHPGL